MSEALIIQLAAIIVPCLSGASGVVALIIYFHKNLRKVKENNEKRRLQDLKDLREAFLMAENDKESRLDALKEYRALGGKNFKDYEKIISQAIR